MRTLVSVGCALFLFLLVTATTKENDHNSDFTEEDFGNIHEDNTTLKLVTVIFRHGNRTPDGEKELYPNDPHLNFSYFPYGLGQLTNVGKIKEYNLGASLRERYHSFLGDYYYPNIVEAITTDYNRTKMSLLLVLAGLFPPSKDDALMNDFSWQPIPYNYLPRSEDKVLLAEYCPRYKTLYKQYSSLPEIQNRFADYRNIFDYISNHTGLAIKSFYDVYNLYFGLSTEEEFGLNLPDWTKSVWPKRIYSVATKEYFISMGNIEMRRLLVGYFLDKVLNDMQAKIDGNRRLSRKIHLYSAHESNVAQLLLALDIFKEHVPAYGSHVILELHKIGDVHGVKIFYDGCDGAGIQSMKLPDCDEFCPLQKFQFLIVQYLNVDYRLCGN